MMFNFYYLKNLLLVIAFCLFLSASSFAVFAQCEGVYFKPSAYKLVTEKVRFLKYPDLFKDVTGDGKIDFVGFVFENGNTQRSKKIYILPNDGNGGFGTPTELTFPTYISGYYNILIADFNSDGKNDFIVNLETNPASVLIYQNNGTGGFAPLTPFILQANEVVGQIVDINNDGIGDALTYFPQSYNYRLGNANGTFGNLVQLSGALGRPGDFNNDGKIDFAYAQNGHLLINYNQGNGIFVLSDVLSNLSNFPFLAETLDFNNDGKLDLLINNSGEYPSYIESITIILNLGNGNFSKTDLQFPTSSNRYVATKSGDFNGDGFPDIFGESEIGPSFYFVFTNNGSGSFIRRDYYANLSRDYNNDYYGNPVGDLDGDGKMDFLKVNNFRFDSNSSENGFTRIFNETRLSILKNVCNKQGHTKTVDFDADLITDKNLWQPNNGRWHTGYSVPPRDEVFYNWGTNGDVPTPGDYDGDGRTDYAVYRPSNGVWYIRNSSDGTFLGVQFGASEDKPVASDYNGDGRTDFAVYRPSSGIWYILYSGTYQFYAARFGIAEDKPVPEDYDGDGKTDVAVFRPSNGVWYVLKSSDGNFIGVQWGSNTDVIVPADYDGDGKADIAVFRPGATAYWYILRSFNQQPFAYPYGTSGDIPQTGDWNGDGLIDLGVYRPGSREWFSSDFIFTTNPPFGLSGEVPISTLNKSY